MVSVETSETWLLLRGLLREQRHWCGFKEHMAEAFPDHNIVTLDIPGVGSQIDQKSPTTITGMVDSLRDQLGGLNCERPIRLLGLSMGGMIAIEWLQRYPLDLKSVVLINTSLRSLSPFYQRLRFQNYPGLLKHLLSPRQIRESHLLQLSSNLPHKRVLAEPIWHQIAQNSPISLHNSFRQLFAASSFNGNLAPPTRPTLVLSSEGDRIVNASCSKTIAQEWRLPHKVHSDAGHDLTLDDPQWVIAEIKSWLKALGLNKTDT